MGIVLKQHSKMNIVNLAALLVISAFAYGVPQSAVEDGPKMGDQKRELLPVDRLDLEFDKLRANLEDESNRQKECPGDCSGNGWCESYGTSGKCSCKTGYEGVDCSVISACEDWDPYWCKERKHHCGKLFQPLVN